MRIVPPPSPTALPTAVPPLPRLFASTQTLGLEHHLQRPKRGVATPAPALAWLVLTWRGSGRPQHLVFIFARLAEGAVMATSFAPRCAWVGMASRCAS